MTPYYGYGRGNKPYFYYQCTKRQHQGSCSMANVPAQPLEDVIARRLNQLSKENRTIERLVKDERVARLTEPRLRHLVGLQDGRATEAFPGALLDATEPHEASRRVR